MIDQENPSQSSLPGGMIDLSATIPKAGTEVIEASEGEAPRDQPTQSSIGSLR